MANANERGVVEEGWKETVIGISEELEIEAAGFGLNRTELEKFCHQLGRLPRREELAVCGALWSEHCSYKSSRVHLRRFHTQELWVLQGPGENAGVVAINEDWGIAFKMESHNHPSYIEPYQGAATGVGGILRDVFCMGARPIANINCLRYGEDAWNAVLLRQTVRGIADYGNSVGVPTVTGDTAFHWGYSKNILINAFTAGLIHKDRIFRGVLREAAPTGKERQNDPMAAHGAQPPASQSDGDAYDLSVLFPPHENVLIYFGSATGRDGVHGATMSSAEFSAGGESLKPTVQVGDPFAEKLIMEATLKLIELGLVVGLQDMGAAGLTSSSVEMAGRSGCGVAIDLSKVPQRASNMQAWEILLSESQERMLVAVQPNRVSEVLAVIRSFDLPCAEVGRVNSTGKFTCLFDGKICTDIPVLALVDDTPKYEHPLTDRAAYLQSFRKIENKARLAPVPGRAIGLAAADKNAYEAVLSGVTLRDFVQSHGRALVTLLGHPAFCSRKPIYDHYCATVQGNTVAAAGALQWASAAVVRLPREAQKSPDGVLGVALAGGCEERWVELDPQQGAAATVLKMARKIAAVGGVPLGMTDCLNFGSPRNPHVMRQISDAVDGINLVARGLSIPIVSGNVSLNNQTDGHPIPPTPMIGMVGRVDDVRRVPLCAWPQEGLVPRTGPAPGSKPSEYLCLQIAPSNRKLNPSFGISAAAWVLGGENLADFPALDLDGERALYGALRTVLQEVPPALLVPVGHGGVLLQAIGMALRSGWSFLPDDGLSGERMDRLLGEGEPVFLAALQSTAWEPFSRCAGAAGLSVTRIGSFLSQPAPSDRSANSLGLAWEEIQRAWEGGIASYFRTGLPSET